MRKTLLDKTLSPLNKFIHYENSAGIILFSSVLLAIIWANSPWAESYQNLLNLYFGLGFDGYELRYSLQHWVNDGLMAMFFFLVGLELKREIIDGELSTMKKAALPFAAAMGGMVVPALIYWAINYDLPSVRGWGIPMATDIVFALALLSLAGKGVPVAAKVFLVALATVDDLGAVLVIALFYTDNLSYQHLVWGLGILAIMVGANKLGIRNTLFYAIVGIVGVWHAFLLSGVHATIAGVLAAFAIPARRRIDESVYSRSIGLLMRHFDREIPKKGPLMTDKQHKIIEKIKRVSSEAQPPLQKIESALHVVVSFVVIPLFALFNSGVIIEKSFFSDLANPITSGVFFGLVFGKLVGVMLFSWVVVKAKIATLPKSVTWQHVTGVAALSGVGFTMSLFITQLAFVEPSQVDMAKYGIMLASVVAAVLGLRILKTQPPLKAKHTSSR